MTGSHISLAMLTDNLSLLDILTNGSSTNEKRLMIYIRTVQSSYNKMEWEDVAGIRSEYIIADTLTKVMKQNILVNAIESSTLLYPKQQWIVRSDKSDSVFKKRYY